jgi:hypothetical protein
MRNRTVIDPKCVTCGEPTKRFYTAKYCWECMKKSNDESYRRRKPYVKKTSRQAAIQN